MSDGGCNDVGDTHRRRALSYASPGPQSQRRTIFPMQQRQNRSPSTSSNSVIYTNSEDTISWQSSDVSTNSVRPPARVLLRANSLDRKMSSLLPKSSPSSNEENKNSGKTNEELLDAIILAPLARERHGHHPMLRRENTTPPRKLIPVSIGTTDSGSIKSPQPTSTTTAGEFVRDKPYYYPLPPVVKDESLSIQHNLRTLPSILRRKRASPQCRPSPCSYKSCCTNLTLASPASITALRIEKHVLERIPSDLAKLLPHIATPSLTMSKSQSGSLSTDTSGGGHRRRHSTDSSSPSSSFTRHVSFESLKRVTYDPAITVHEFIVPDFEKSGGGKWWTEDEMEEFKREAVQRIRAMCVDIIPTGTGRTLLVPGIVTGVTAAAKRNNNISFNHPALGFEDEFDPELRGERVKEIMGYLTQEIRSILVVDPHPIFHSLFRKSLKHMLPFIAVASALSAEEALLRIQAAQHAFSVKDGGSSHGFDVIIIEENLIDSPVWRQEDLSAQIAGENSIQQITSGSSLISQIAKSQRELKLLCDDDELRLTFIIGVSARLVDHRERLEKAGADIVWGKPPPEMNATLRNSLLRTIMTKRRRRIDFKVFDC